MQLPFHHHFHKVLPRLQGAWDRVREVIPPCTEKDDKTQLVKPRQSSNDTEMAAMGNYGAADGDTGGATYTNFGAGDEGGAGSTPDPKMNGDLLVGEEFGFVDGEGGDGGEFGVVAHKISEWQAGWNVTNAIQGMFIVSLPFAVRNGGYWGIVAMIAVAYICCHTGKILVECLYETDDDGHQVRKRSSYVAIAEACFGRRFGGWIVHVAQMIELLMTCILYVVLCGDLMIGTFPTGALDQRSWMMMCGMLLLPCAFLRTLRSVSFLSFWNTVVHLIINIMIISYCLTCASTWAWNKVQVRIDIYTFPISMGIVVFSYTSHIFLPTLEGSLQDRSRFNCMLNWSHVAAAIFKALFAYIAFLTWANDTDEVITNNLTSGFKGFINTILVIKALLSYPLPFYAAIDLLEVTFFRGPPATRLPSCFALDGMLKIWALVLRLLVVIFTILMAVSIPHFGILMGFIGNFTGTMLSFVWPAYFHLRLKWNTLQWYIISLDVFIICLGGFCGVIGIYYSGRALVEAYHIHIKIPNVLS